MCEGKKQLNIILKLTYSSFLEINCAKPMIHVDLLGLYIGIDIIKYILWMLELSSNLEVVTKF